MWDVALGLAEAWPNCGSHSPLASPLPTSAGRCFSHRAFATALEEWPFPPGAVFIPSITLLPSPHVLFPGVVAESLPEAEGFISGEETSLKLN